MNDLKNSTLGERVLLGVIAGLFALVGFYVGYEHLSNGVNPILIGAITALIVMIGCMAAAFVFEELMRKIPGRKKYEEERKKPLFDAGSKLAPGEEFEDKKEKESSTETAKTESKPSFAKRMTLLPSLKEQRLEKENTEEAVKQPDVKTSEIKETPKQEELVAENAPTSSSEWDTDDEIIVKPKPVAPVKPVSPKAPLTTKVPVTTVTPQEPEEKIETSEAPSLVDFIKAHPEYSARKMVKEYRLAGGIDSTDDILNLMN